MQKTVIRPAGEGDIPAIIALYRELDAAMVDLQPEFFCEAPREEAEISSAVKAQDADFLLAEQDGTPVGFALSPTPGGRPRTAACCPTATPGWKIWSSARLTVAGASAANCWPPPSAGPGTGGWNT